MNFSKNIVFLYLELFFTITNSVDPDEMLHDVAFNPASGSSLFVKVLPFSGFPYTNTKELCLPCTFRISGGHILAPVLKYLAVF